MLNPMFYTKIEEQTDDYGRFTFEPLHSSFAQSMGNALRRTMLSSLPGSAIGYVKVEGAAHLFSTLTGVKESVLDVVLNLKQVRFKVTSEGEHKVTVSKKGPGKVFAKDLHGDVEVVNGDAYIAEVTDDKGALELTAIIESGYGFVAAED